MDKKIAETLINNALKAAGQSYSPYSGFKVGAALLAKSGKIYTGANIESASYTPTVCAERVAFFTAVHNGEREFCAIAIIGGKAGEVSDYCPPCGVCRQVMAEFCRPDFEIIMFNGSETKIKTLGELLPESFTKSNI